MIRVALDISPLSGQSQYRGVGMYTRKLLESLRKQKNVEVYEFSGTQVPKETEIIHYPYFFPFLAGLPVFPGKKYIVTVHDLTPLVFPKNYPPGYLGKITFLAQKFLLKRASMVLTDSENSARDIVKFIGYPAEKIKVVYLAAANRVKRISDKIILQGIRLKFNLPEKFVLYVGDVNYNKNLPGLIKACRLAKITPVIVGKQAVSNDFDPGHIENQPLVELNNLVRSGVNIIRTGFVPEDELAGLYSLASVYCQPSFYEGFGVPLLEAMACGCPVVTSNVSSLPEVAGEAAVLVDPENAEEIAGGIKKIIENKNIREKLIREGFERASFFSWEKTARETIKAYEKIIA